MSNFLARLIPRSAVVVLLALTLAAVAAFAAVSHLVTRFTANQQARGRKLYQQGLADMAAHNPAAALDAFRAALTCDRSNPEYQLNLGRALRDTGRLDEAESYLSSLWERAPEDGPINLALARVAARRGSIDEALRYYHSAMYGVWPSGNDHFNPQNGIWFSAADANRRKARLELVEFLLQKQATGPARSELVALAAVLPPESDSDLHLQVAKLFEQAQDFPGALSEYEKAGRLDHLQNPAALAGAGEAAYRAGRYLTAQRYLQAAVQKNPGDSDLSGMLASTALVLQIDPLIRGVSFAERNRRISFVFTTAGNRLKTCAAQKGISFDSVSTPADESVANGGAPFLAGVARSGDSASTSNSPATSTPLIDLYSRWLSMKPELTRHHSAVETDSPETIMNLAFEIEEQTAKDCGQPQGDDEALLLISRDPQGVDQ